MQCLSCGTIIQPGAMRCPSCGTHTPLYTSDAISHAYDGEAIPYIPYNPHAGTSLESRASTSNSTASLPLSQSSQPIPLVAPLQQPVEQKSAQRHGILTSTTVLLVILVLLIVVSGIGLTSYATIFHPWEMHAQATAVTRSILTAQGETTATANANSPQNIYNRVTSKRPTYSDPLDGQLGGLWSSKGQGDSGCMYSQGAYHIRLSPKDFYFYCSATGNDYSNFIFQVQMTIFNGYQGGIVFYAHDQNSPISSYVFAITFTGLYVLEVSTDFRHSKILAFGRSSAINIGLNQPNLVTAMGQGGRISLFINKHFVTSIDDTSYSSGGIGLIATNLPQTTVDVAFNNVQVWSLP